LCKTYKKTPDDPWIVDMDPVLKMWMYNQWIGDQTDDAELAKNHAYLLASFWNPEAVQKILGESGAKTFESDEESYQESMRMVREQSLNLYQNKEKPIKRRRRLIKQ